ncbi:hypothetical protein NP493_1126g00022 [Ridgeia piscesae]|uniref:Uncharacterized protein n=1 Tax=Ridgeia piscesae TaxID=27915 RepID=A0AAD9NJK9_RIDPI|nr:hypothetical protein NP493_1126g00022 [Ridgeia piscesae]
MLNNNTLAGPLLSKSIYTHTTVLSYISVATYIPVAPHQDHFLFPLIKHLFRRRVLHLNNQHVFHMRVMTPAFTNVIHLEKMQPLLQQHGGIHMCRSNIWPRGNQLLSGDISESL